MKRRRERPRLEPAPREPVARPPEAVLQAAVPRPLWAHPALWVALATVALYLPGLRHGFVWDDQRLIATNPLLRSGPGLARLLLGDFWLTSGLEASGFWRPLVTLSYALDGLVGRWSPEWFHAMNLLAHAAAAALVTLLALQDRVPRSASLAGGLLFATLPAHVESVAWISGRTDVYCAAFFLLALLLDRRARARGARGPGLGAPLALALALLAKETAVCFAGLAALALWSDARATPRSWRARARWLAPYAAVTVLYLLAHAWMARAAPLPARIDPLLRERGTWAAWTMFPGYLAFLWPGFPHSPAVTLRLPDSPWSPAVLGGAAAQAAFVAALAVLAWRRARAALPLALFWLTLLPPTVVMFAQSHLLFAERFLFLPSAGLAWAAALGLGAVGRGRATRIAAGALTALLVGWGALVTLRLLPAWASDETLFQAMTVVQPRNAMGHVQWARVLAARGREREAAAELDAAAALDPTRPEVHSVRALIHYRHGDWARVLEEAERALALDSLLLEPRLARATALLRLGRVATAQAALERLWVEAPGDPAVGSLLGQALARQRRPAEAVPLLEDAARRAPGDPDLQFALGMAAGALGRLPAARAAFEAAVRADSGFYDAWLRLALACALLRDTEARDRALARAAACPEARDGRAADLRRRLATAHP
ncbi:MAG: hypothetical protein HZC42_05415 [Candidatus Eisenbacteria bacterium]|nr:hypothetical protein [Candidatus Eisenbacteria bacterium]